MANRTDPEARNIHGKNPQFLIEKIVRDKIYNSVYWKRDCFGLNAESLIEKAVELVAVGGTFGGNRQPSEFLCLLLKLLQIQPSKEIVVEFITNENFKYLRVLGAAYLRLTGKPLDVYQYLEPLLQDYRKIRFKDEMGRYYITHIDEIVDSLLRKSHCFNISLPKLTSRRALEETGALRPRESVLADLDNLEAEEVDESEVEDLAKKSDLNMAEAKTITPPHDKRKDLTPETGKVHGSDEEGERREHGRRHRDRDRERKRKRRRERDDGGGRDRKRRSSREKQERYSKIFTKEGAEEKGASRQASLSVDETNKLREKLGLKKLYNI